MFERLTVVNLPPGYDPCPSNGADDPFFILKTCQRTLILALRYPAFRPSSNNFSSDTGAFCQEVFFGEKAYIFVLEVLCGLKSKILAENEIAGQFKEAYKAYVQLPRRDGMLIKVLEKLLKDAKSIRKNYLMGLAQKSYANLARKILLKKGLSQKGVLLLGSGALALDLIHQLKKWVPLTLSARNQQKAQELRDKYDISLLPWDAPDLYGQFSSIICAIGTEETLLDESFFQSWKMAHGPRCTFIDFGHPSCIETTLDQEDGIFRLTDIFQQEQHNQQYKIRQVQLAQKAIYELVHSRRVPMDEAPIDGLAKGSAYWSRGTLSAPRGKAL